MKPEEESVIRFRGTDNAKIVKLIRTAAPMGAGTETDPVRTCVPVLELRR